MSMRTLKDYKRKTMELLGPDPGDDVIARLRHTVKAFSNATGNIRPRWAVQATHNVYGPSKTTGLTFDDLAGLEEAVRSDERRLIAECLAELELQDNTGDPADSGYMDALADVAQILKARQPAEAGRCPDGGKCHHGCISGCFRVVHASPLSGIFPGDRWPAAVKIAWSDLQHDDGITEAVVSSDVADKLRNHDIGPA